MQLRPQQATLGALVLICTEDVTAFAQISDAAFAEQSRAVRDIEATLSRLFGYDRINYLMLMMVDPQVHYHVLPRYSAAPRFDGTAFEDPGWPGPPQLGHATEIGDATRQRLLDRLRGEWPA